MMVTQLQVSVDQTLNLEENDLLEARIITVEGRKVVHLIQKTLCGDCNTPLKAVNKSNDEIELLCMKCE